MTPVETKRELLERIRRHFADFQQLGVRRLGVFGSFQRDEVTPESDVDILVDFRAGEKSFSNLFELSELLERTLDREVEVVTPESVPSALQDEIFEDVEYVEAAGRLSR